MPTLLEYFSYLFHYSTVLAGPVCTFKEFNDFIDGSDVRPKVTFVLKVTEYEPWLPLFMISSKIIKFSIIVYY